MRHRGYGNRIIPKLSVKLNIKNMQIADKLSRIDTSKVGGKVSIQAA
jgi:hypothetical protein